MGAQAFCFRTRTTEQRAISKDTMMLLRALLLPSIFCTADGANYYVSPSGSDSATGTSSSTAWRTLDRASMQKFLPGDSLLLSRNAAWIDDPLTIGNAKGLTVGSF